MKKITVDRRNTTFFSDLSNTINDNQEELSQYIQSPFGTEGFKKQIQIKEKSFTAEQRSTLHQVVSKQLSPYSKYDKLQKNVDLLKEENTFTVTAGHQLNLFGGPLYTLYKMFDVIRLAEELTQKIPTSNFVPVFWMATEDHDFEEINHIHLFNDTLAWESTQKGPVGRFSLDGIADFKEKIVEKFQNNAEFADYLNEFYKGNSLAESTVQYFMDLVGEYGLVILDADNRILKSSFAPIIKKEIETHFSEKEILKTTKELEVDGYHGQAMARPINLFYIKDQFRERIIPMEDGNFQIGEETKSKSDLMSDLDQYPERFSPNVVFRPLYQESILPNLCYVGGGGEMSYWLQLKGMFEQTNIPYPLIKVRNSIQWIDKSTAKKIDKLDLKYTDIFESIHEVKKQFVIDNTDEELVFKDLDAQVESLRKVLEKSIVDVDKGLEGYAKSEITKILKQTDAVKDKLIRHQKKKHEEAMIQIDGIYSRSFPNNGLQERYDNAIPYLAKFGAKEYIEILHQSIDPFDKDLILLVEE